MRRRETGGECNVETGGVLLRYTSLSVAVGLVSLALLARAMSVEADPGPKGADADLAKPAIDYLTVAKKGTLKNPYTDNPKAIAEGKQLYFSYSCNGCHGGTGGGGMCPPLSNAVWIYGSDDDTLFRLMALGSKKLNEAGYARKRTEKVKGPMVPFGELVENADELWKILAFVRTTYRGDPKRRNW